MRLLKAIHAWAGIFLGLLLLLPSITGTLLVWKDDYVLLRLPKTSELFTATPETLAVVGEAVEKQFDNNQIVLIQFATETFPFTKVYLADGGFAYLNSDGETVDRWQRNQRFEEWLFDLHHRLLLDNFGLTLLGLSAIALMVVLLLGIIVFWPARRAFKRGVLPRAFNRGQLQASHRNLGVIVALPLLLVLITAALLAFPEQSEQLLLQPFRDDQYSLDFDQHVDEISGGNSGDWLPALQRAVASFPNAEIRTAMVPNAISPYRIIGMQQSGELNPNGKSQIYFEAAGGWMDLRIDATRQPLSERIYNLSYPLHTGRIDSLSYKIFLTLVGLSIATLVMFGMLSFIKRFVAKTKIDK